MGCGMQKVRIFFCNLVEKCYICGVIIVTSGFILLHIQNEHINNYLVMKDIVVYYNEFGNECDEKDAVEMSILSFDSNGNYLGSVRGKCQKQR